MMLTNRQIRIKLFESLKNSFYRKSVFISFVLMFCLLVSAFALIYVRFEYKMVLSQEKNIIVKNSELDEQWSQIVLEYGSLATPTAIENFTRSEEMSLPTKKNIKYIKADGSLNETL